MLEIIFILFLVGFIIWLAKKHKEIAWAIAIAFVLRISATLINLYVVTLPDGGIDATGFVIKSKRKYLNNALFINMFHLVACWLWVLAI